MRNLKIQFLVFGILSFADLRLSSQILTVTPAFPRLDDTVTIIYNAAMGNGALKDRNINVYAHTGLITEKSVSPTDWKYVQGNWGTPDSRVLMTSLGNNLYQIRFHMRSYYRIISSEKALQMAFVFRNADGSVVGRDPQGQDIYYDLRDETQSLQARWESLIGRFNFCKAGDVLNGSVLCSDSSDISLFLDEVLVRSERTDLLKWTYTINDQKRHDIRAEIYNKTEKLILRYTCLPAQTSPVLALPAGSKMGANILQDSSIRFVLSAPFKKSVYLLSSSEDYQPLLMNLSNDGYSFWIDIKPKHFGQTIFYQYLVDELIYIADPLSQVVLDTRNDNLIPESVFPNLPKVKEQQINGFISMTSNHPDTFTWSKKLFTPPPKNKLNIYELLIRDFELEHSFDAVTRRLDYLQELGINAIQLMPVNEFEGNNSWGYNPAIHQSLDKYYGTIQAIKNLIDQCHQRGMAVILDVVFNHAFGQSPLARMYWDAGNNRPAANSPYLNPVAKHPFNVGYDFNHESAFTKRYVNQVLSYWLREFHIDGFRFDLSKGFTQTDYGNDVERWSRYDAARINILKNYANQVWSINPNAYFICEHFAENREESELSEYGMLLWGNMNNNYSQWTMGYNSNDLNAVMAGPRGWKQPHLIGYMESHDEERLMYKNLLFGNSSGNYKIKDLKTALKRMEMAHVFFWLLPGPKMIWQFGELGYDYSINTCIGGSVNPNCRLDPKPIRWDYLQDRDRTQLLNTIQKLLILRNRFEVVHSGQLDAQLQEGLTKQLALKSTELNLVAAANGDVTTRKITVRFPHTGIWYDYLSRDSIFVSSNDFSMEFTPGEYHVWTNRSLSGLVGVEDPGDSGTFIFPNPAFDHVRVRSDQGIINMRMYDLQGRLMKSTDYPSVQETEFELPSCNGLYHLLINTTRGRITRSVRIIKP